VCYTEEAKEAWHHHKAKGKQDVTGVHVTCSTLWLCPFALM